MRLRLKHLGTCYGCVYEKLETKTTIQVNWLNGWILCWYMPMHPFECTWLLLFLNWNGHLGLLFASTNWIQCHILSSCGSKLVNLGHNWCAFNSSISHGKGATCIGYFRPVLELLRRTLFNFSKRLRKKKMEQNPKNTFF